MENVTLDGKKIDIYANIGGVEDAASALANDAGGIGLFRSEFLFLERTDYPSEEEQFAAYKKVLEDMAVGAENDFFPGGHRLGSGSGKNSDQAVGNVPHICCPRRHIDIAHCCKSFRKGFCRFKGMSTKWKSIRVWVSVKR